MSYDLRSLCIYPNGMSPLVGLLKLMNLPQKVTSRYVRNLLIKGRNNDFTINTIERFYHQIDNVVIGNYFNATLTGSSQHRQTATGVTPEQAVYRCLIKYGVT